MVAHHRGLGGRRGQMYHDVPSGDPNRLQGKIAVNLKHRRILRQNHLCHGKFSLEPLQWPLRYLYIAAVMDVDAGNELVALFKVPRVDFQSRGTSRG